MVDDELLKVYTPPLLQFVCSENINSTTNRPSDKSSCCCVAAYWVVTATIPLTLFIKTHYQMKKSQQKEKEKSFLTIIYEINRKEERKPDIFQILTKIKKKIISTCKLMYHE